jgi:hypothetical protein
MAIEAKAINRIKNSPVIRHKYQATLKFDYIMVSLSSWLIAGLYLDGWAHNNIPQLETFFTPWHGVLYSGFFVTALYLTFTYTRNRRRGYPGKYALPAGYELSMLGALIFLVGGVADGVGHTLFGIERGLEPLISPTHLQLALGGILIISGPARSLWRRQLKANHLNLSPLVLSFTLIYLVLSFFTQFAHPITVDWTYTRRLTSNVQQFYSLGMTAILLQAALLSGICLLLVRYWRLPVGSLAFLMALSNTLMSLMIFKLDFILPGIMSALVAEILLYLLKPSSDRVAAFRIFAFALPASWCLILLVSRLVEGDLQWSIYLSSGAGVLAGVVGLFISYLLILPKPEIDPD